jgi:hypothetical protein
VPLNASPLSSRSPQGLPPSPSVPSFGSLPHRILLLRRLAIVCNLWLQLATVAFREKDSPNLAFPIHCLHHRRERSCSPLLKAKLLEREATLLAGENFDIAREIAYTIPNPMGPSDKTGSSTCIPSDRRSCRLYLPVEPLIILCGRMRGMANWQKNCAKCDEQSQRKSGYGHLKLVRFKAI